VNYPAASCGVSNPGGNERRDKMDRGIWVEKELSEILKERSE